jgi:hypothetical protein
VTQNERDVYAALRRASLARSLGMKDAASENAKRAIRLLEDRK